MPSLKDLRSRIDSVKSTRKITSAMKMVSAAKLRRAQEQAEVSRPYAERLEAVLRSLAKGQQGSNNLPLLTGREEERVHLIALFTADRGLAGGFNANLLKGAQSLANELMSQGKEVKFLTVGRKARDFIRRQFGDKLIQSFSEIDRPELNYAKAEEVARVIDKGFTDQDFDACTIVYAEFKSALTQIVTKQPLIPFAASLNQEGEEAQEKSVEKNAAKNAEENHEQSAGHEYEPSEEAILSALLPRNLGTQIFKAMLENQASEHGARMTAMDAATRNSGEMIDRLTLQYNRSRQAQITKELIEIVSGAEAL